MISSISVHPRFDLPNLSEHVAVPSATAADLAPYQALPFADWGGVKMNDESYGPLKRACELAAMDAIGDRAIILRAGLLVGAGDRSDRLTWWVRRIDQGGRIPVPVDRPVQCIDVRDVADFALSAALQRASGVFNVTSARFSLNTLLGAINRLSGAKAQFVPLPDQTLLEGQVGPWINLPLWLPQGPEHEHFLIFQ